MSESGQRQRVLRALRPIDGQPVENRIGAGMPDISYIGGWIELKWLRRWPSLGSTVRIDHFTQVQRRWLRNHYLKGGNAWVLLQCQQEWLLFIGLEAYERVGHDMCRTELYAHAHHLWLKGLKDRELVDVLRSYHRDN